MKHLGKLLKNLATDLYKINGGEKDDLGAVASWLSCVAEDISNAYPGMTDDEVEAVVYDTTMGLVGNLRGYTDAWTKIVDAKQAKAEATKGTAQPIPTTKQIEERLIRAEQQLNELRTLLPKVRETVLEGAMPPTPPDTKLLEALEAKEPSFVDRTRKKLIDLAKPLLERLDPHEVKDRLFSLRYGSTEVPYPKPSADEMTKCNVPPPGWECSRGVGHDGPCAATPTMEHRLEALEATQEALGARQREILGQQLEETTKKAEDAAIDKESVKAFIEVGRQGSDALPLAELMEAINTDPDKLTEEQKALLHRTTFLEEGITTANYRGFPAAEQHGYIAPSIETVRGSDAPVVPPPPTFDGGAESCRGVTPPRSSEFPTPLSDGEIDDNLASMARRMDDVSSLRRPGTITGEFAHASTVPTPRTMPIYVTARRPEGQRAEFDWFETLEYATERLEELKARDENEKLYCFVTDVPLGASPSDITTLIDRRIDELCAEAGEAR